MVLQKAFSSNDLHRALHNLGRHISFVQIGAMDGVMFDPLHQHIKNLGWRGLLVEPIPDMFDKLKQNYATCRGLRFAQTAIADHDGTAEMRRIDPAAVMDGALPVGALGISTLMFDRGILGNHFERIDGAIRQNLQHYTQKLTVSCCRLPTLLRRYAIRRIDLLAVDAEGADWMIVRQLPLRRFKPRVIYMEYDHLPPRERIACCNYLRSHGYTLRLDQVRSENLLAQLSA